MTIRAKRRGGAMLAVGLFLALLPVDAAVWAQDRLEDAVGRVLRNGKGHCSAVLIERNLVMTAAHCVARKKPWRALPARALQVRIAGEAYGVARATVSPRSPFNADGKAADLSNDWAFLELSGIPPVEPVPYGGTEAASRAFALDEPIVKLGWKRPVADGQHRARCLIADFDRAKAIFLFTCGADAGEGRSGSALFVPAGDGFEVVGVQSGEARTSGPPLGIGISPAMP